MAYAKLDGNAGGPCEEPFRAPTLSREPPHHRRRLHCPLFRHDPGHQAEGRGVEEPVHDANSAWGARQDRGGFRRWDGHPARERRWEKPVLGRDDQRRTAGSRGRQRDAERATLVPDHHSRDGVRAEHHDVHLRDDGRRKRIDDHGDGDAPRGQPPRRRDTLTPGSALRDHDARQPATMARREKCAVDDLRRRQREAGGVTGKEPRQPPRDPRDRPRLPPEGPLHRMSPEFGTRTEIVAVGRELLTGRTVDTNSAWIAARLTDLGAFVARIVTVDDDPAAIAREIAGARERGVALVITTGGLGPTLDDRTL